MSELFTQPAIDQALAGLTGWTQQDNAIARTFTLRSFPAALAFAAGVGHLAERADHHPDILIQYKRVTLTLATHAAGGLTEQDFALAAEIDRIA